MKNEKSANEKNKKVLKKLFYFSLTDGITNL
jgi:hypothetical protein